MTDNDIADRLVALGIIRAFPLRYELSKIAVFTTAHSLVRDWRIAGAVIGLCNEDDESWDELGGYLGSNTDWDGGFTLNNTLANPRAILEACVKSLEGV